MSCAGCDHCPEDHWHLHVTVAGDFRTILADRCAELSRPAKLVRVTNVMRDGSDYVESIPTLHFRGTEAHAVHALFDMACELQHPARPYMVTRLKIEGDARVVPPGRALYYETHLKDLVPEAEVRAKNLRLPRSLNAREQSIYTVRYPVYGQVYELAWSLLRNDTKRVLRIEACVLDTAPELDDAWINQRGPAA